MKFGLGISVMNSYWIRVLILASASFISTPLSAETNSQCSHIPSAVKDILKADFPGWSIVEFHDLSLDDRYILARDNSKKCPGFVVGYIKSKDDYSYGVSLFRNVDDKKEQMLLVIGRDGSVSNVDKISEAQEVSRLSIIKIMPTGTYIDIDSGASVNIVHQGIAYEAIEAGSVLFFWDGKKFDSIQISE